MTDQTTCPNCDGAGWFVKPEGLERCETCEGMGTIDQELSA